MIEKIKHDMLQTQGKRKRVNPSYGLFNSQQCKDNILLHFQKGTLFKHGSTLHVKVKHRKQKTSQQDYFQWLQELNIPSIRKKETTSEFVKSLGGYAGDKENFLNESYERKSRVAKRKLNQFKYSTVDHIFQHKQRKKGHNSIIEPIIYSSNQHLDSCKRQKMREYFKEDQLENSEGKQISINEFKRVRGLRNRYKYRTFEESINSLHEKPLVQCDNLSNLSMHQVLKKKKTIRARSTYPQNLAEIESDHVPKFLTQKLLT